MTHLPVLQHYSSSTKFIIFLALFVFCFFLSSLVGALVLIPFADFKSIPDLINAKDFNDPNVILGLKLMQIVSAIGSFIVPAFIFAFLESAHPATYLKIIVKPRPASLLLGALIIISAGPLINWMAELNGNMVLPDFLSGVEQWMREAEEQAEKMTKAFLKMDNVNDLVLNLFMVALLAALGEELLFRGVVQRLLISWTNNQHWGIWITAIFFSAFHFQFYGFLPRMMLGVLLGYLLIWSRSLWVPIFVHFVNNAFAVIVSYYIERGEISEKIETIGSKENDSYLVISSFVLVSGLLYLLYRLEKNRSSTLKEKDIA